MSSTSCPSGDILIAFQKEQLAETERSAIESHLEDGCQICNDFLDNVLRQDSPVHDQFIKHPPSSPFLRTTPYISEPEQSGNGSPTSNLPRVPGYEILNELGKGGMGVVYRARHLTLNRIVAVKMIRSGSQAERSELDRFRTEAEAVARLQHPHIVQIFEVGDCNNMPFFSLEFCPGGSLQSQLKKTLGQPHAAARLVETLARAMQHAHERGIVHRDLKPANVLLTEKGVPKITDFGLAKKLNEEGQTVSGAVMGTPSYMAPEQAGGHNKQHGPAVDIYALGAVLYALLTGRPPFIGSNLVETLRRVQEDDPSPPRKLQPGTPRDLETICLKCLSKDPGKRYASAADLAADLVRFQAGEPVLARPVGALERTWRWMRRRPTLAAVYILVPAVLLLCAIGGGAAWLWQRAEGKRRRAEGLRTEADEAKVRANDLADALRVTLGQLQQAQDELERVKYMDQVALAGSEWQAGNAAYARVLLEGCQEKYRGWEWHYLNRVFHPESAILTRPSSAIRCVAFSPDGARLVTGSYDGKLQIWDAASGRHLALCEGHKGAVSSLCFSPDGNRVASSSQDGTAQVWDTASGSHLLLQQANAGQLDNVCFSPDGTRVAAEAHDKTARVWDATSGKQLVSLVGHTNFVFSLCFSPDGTRLATASRDETARVWDAASGKQLLVLQGHKAQVVSVSFSPDGACLATACWDGTARIWDSATGKQLAILEGHTGQLNSLCFSPDGARLATVGSDMTARVWNTSGKQLALLQGHTGATMRSCFSPDGSRLATASMDGTARIWDAASGKELVVLTGHTRFLLTVSFSPDGARLATTSSDGTVRVWNATERNRALYRFGIGGSAFFSADGMRMALSSADGTLRVRDARSDKWALLPGHDKLVLNANFSPDGTRLATASADGKVGVWDTDSGKRLYFLQGLTQGAQCVRFSPDGTRLATGSADNTARIWDAATGRQLLVLEGHTGAVQNVDFSADGNYLATSSGDETVRVWDITTGKQRALVNGHNAGLLNEIFSPDGSRLATTLTDGTVRVWDASSGKQLAMLEGYKFGAQCIRFSPNGALLATASDEARVWDAVSGKQLALLQGHTSAVYSVSFSPDGTRLATSSVDGTARVWDTTSGKQLVLLQGHTLAVWTVSFSSDGARLCTASQDGTARVWIANESEETFQQRCRYSRRPLADEAEQMKNWFAAAFFLDQLIRDEPGNADLYRRRAFAYLELGKRTEALATSDKCRAMQSGIFPSHPSALPGPRLLAERLQAVSAVAYSRDGKRVLSAGQDRMMRLWNLENGKELRQFHGHADSIGSVALSPDGKIAISGAQDRTVRLWSVESGEEIGRCLMGDGASCVRFTPDGRWAVATCPDRKVRFLDVETGRLDHEFTYPMATLDITFTADSKRFFLGNSAGPPFLCDATTGKVIPEFPGHQAIVHGETVSPDGKRAVSATQDGTLRLWDLENGREMRVFIGHVNSVRAVAFLPDGRHFLSVGEDSTLRLWDGDTGEERYRGTQHTAAVRALALSPDGRSVLTGSYDGSIRLWKLPDLSPSR